MLKYYWIKYKSEKSTCTKENSIMQEKGLQLTILTAEELEKRYLEIKDPDTIKITQRIVEEGYLIGLMEYEELSKQYIHDWANNAKKAVADKLNISSYYINFYTFTDLSEVINDKIYFAFKTKI